MCLRLGAAVFVLAVVWLASQALDSGGPLAVYAIAVLVYAVERLMSSVAGR